MSKEWSEHCEYCGWVTEIRPHMYSCPESVEEIHTSDRQVWLERIARAACDQDGNWWRRVEAAVATGRQEWIDEFNGNFREHVESGAKSPADSSPIGPESE